MRSSAYFRRTDGAAAVEFVIVAPLFLAALYAVFQISLAVWTQLGLQHAVESAARCAVVYSKSTCNSASAIQSYAATQVYGLNIPPSVFSYSVTNSCDNLVTASYTYYFFSNEFAAGSKILTAQACFQN